MTDNGSCYRSQAFREACRELGLKHIRTSVPDFGMARLAATAIGLLAMTTRWRAIAATILGGFWIVSAGTWTAPILPSAWVGVDTEFRGAAGQYTGCEQQLETLGMVLDAAKEGAEAVVLPESPAGIWTPTTEALWRGPLQGTRVTVNLGAIAVGSNGYDNVMVDVSATGQRCAIPSVCRCPCPCGSRGWLGSDGLLVRERTSLPTQVRCEAEGLLVGAVAPR